MSSPVSILVMVLICVVLFLILFTGIWCSIVFLISRTGGWGRLSQCYAAGDRVLTGEARRRVTGGIGLASYRHALTIHQGEEGFFLDVMPMFRVGHPRLFIPWAEVSGRSEQVVARVKTECVIIGHPAIATLKLPVGVLKSAAPSQ